MEGHGQISVGLLIAEVCFHSSIKRLFVSNDSAELEMVCHFGRCFLNLDFWGQVSLFHVLSWLLLSSATSSNVVSPIFIHGFIENKSVLIAP